MNTATFTKGTFDRRLINFNFAFAIAYLTDSKFGEKAKGVYSFPFTKGTSYHFYGSPSLERCLLIHDDISFIA
jgi:hypothetical protein